MDQTKREQFERIVPAIANSEVRALLLGSMSLHNATGGLPLDAPGLNEMMLNMQGNEPGWDMSYDAHYKYCKKYFSKVGLAVPHYYFQGRHVATKYSISDLGDGLGTGIAGAALDGSLRFPDISLQPILGKMDGRRKNSFVQRLGWLRALVAAGNNGVERVTLMADRFDKTELTYVIKQMTRGAFSRLVINEDGKADNSEDSSFTRVRLKPAFQEPVGVFLDNFDAVLTPKGLKHFKKQAIEIVRDDPKLCAELMAKAKRDSIHMDHLFPVAES